MKSSRYILLIISFLFTKAIHAEVSSQYSFNPVGKKDPFRPFSVAAPSLQVLSKLQEFEFRELSLVGTMLGKEMSALISIDQTGEGVIARVGDKIGKNGGRIVAIVNEKIVIRQPVIGGTPGKRFDDLIMVLKPRKIESNISAGSLQNFGMRDYRPRDSGQGQKSTGPSINTFIPPPLDSANAAGTSPKEVEPKALAPLSTRVISNDSSAAAPVQNAPTNTSAPKLP